MLTIFQITGVTAAYLGVTLVLPWLLLRGKLSSLRLPARFMAYFMAGNFFCMNLVFLLQLLRISNRATLIIGTLLPFLVAAAVKYKTTFSAVLEKRTRGLRIVMEGEMGVKTLMLRMGNRMRRFSSGWLGQWLAPRWPDVLLTMGIIVLILYMYGTNTVNVYGYCASDIVVHNYWINYMENNHIFVDGVYPFGFHCVIYYLHEVFAIPTYVLLRVFALVQVLMIHLMLLAFLKLVCKSKYTPYAGVAAYIMTDVLYEYTYLRYYAPLPQEYGMIFILPSIYFVIGFLGEKDFVSLGGKKGKVTKKAGLFLILFSISISMTLAVHFYDAIVAGLFCIAIGAGFCFRCLRWRYLKRLLLAGVTGIAIAVLPMAAAFAMGTSLQGSLYWGMSVISSDGEESDESEAAGGEEGAGIRNPDEEEASGNVLDHVLGELQYYVTNNSRRVAEFLLYSTAFLFVLGIVWCLMKRPDYGAVLVSVSIFTGLLCILQASEKLGLPQLIEVSRYSIYIGYALPLLWSLCLDGVVYLLFREHRGINLGGLGALAAALGAVAFTGFRMPVYISAYETNGAITCLTNILRENKGSISWTICSANDEQQMTWGLGYHYETIEFLREMETVGEDTEITIPTDTVYFFIEKVPLLYLGYLNTIKPEKEISLEGARMPLPSGDGITPYGENDRWVTMSHMYYWAQAFRELYPNEMEVYYETDDFICYRIRQDGFSLYNFAIDYGYNY